MMRRGFTLLELLVVIAIAAILLAVGVPALAEWVDRYRVESEARAFQAALTQARSEALGRGQRVVLAPLPGGWSQGWRLFVDGNRSGEFEPDSDPNDASGSGDRELIAHLSAAQVAIVADFGSAWGERIIFLPGAYVRGAGGSELAGRMGFGSGRLIRSVCLSALGRNQMVAGETCPA